MASWIWGSSLNPQLEDLVGSYEVVFAPVPGRPVRHAKVPPVMLEIEKACSPLNLPWPESEDIALNLEISDLIRSKTVSPKSAVLSLKSRLASKNGRVQMSVLGLADTCIKNGGDHFLQEIAGKEFVGEMIALIKAPATIPQVRDMALSLFQQWALVFEPKSSLSYLPEMYRELKSEGVKFPPAPSAVSTHLLTTATPPNWIDSESCMRCRTPFTFTNRKHHCRNCGLVFDQACSSKAMPLPHLGITQDVRVCEPCFNKTSRGKLSKNDPTTPMIPAKRSVKAAQYEADLQRAIALSLAEGDSTHVTNGLIGSHPGMTGRRLEGSDAIDPEDEDLRLAIEASLADVPTSAPTAPGYIEEEEANYKPLPTYDLSAREMETMLSFAQTIDHAVGFGDRDLRRFPHVHGLYNQAHNLSAKMQRNVDEKSTKHQMLTEMHARLMQAVRRYDSLLTEQETYARAQYSQPHLGTHAPSFTYASASIPPYQYPSHIPPTGDTRLGDPQAWAQASHQGSNPISPFAPVERQTLSQPYHATREMTMPHQSFETRPPIHDGLDQQGFSRAPRMAASVPDREISLVPSPWSENPGYPNGHATRATTYPVDHLPRLPNVPSHALPILEEPTLPRQERQEEALLIEL